MHRQAKRSCRCWLGRKIFQTRWPGVRRSFQTATIAGPMIGGIIYGITGSPLLVYVCAALAYSTAFVLLSRIDLEQVERRASAASVKVLLEGLQFIGRNKLILGAISLDLFAVLLGAGGRAFASLCARDLKGRCNWFRRVTKRPRGGRARHGHRDRPLALAAARRTDDALVRVRIRDLHSHFRALAQRFTFARDAVSPRRLGHGQRDRETHVDSTFHAR